VTSEQGNAVPRLVSGSRELHAKPGMPRIRSRWMIDPPSGAWDGVVLSEWELTAAGWADRHPHTETNVVLEGELHVEAGGVTVVATAGDTVTVPAGEIGRYWAPIHARMVGIYGPNPEGHESTDFDYWEL
jgi:mannose-6-phosphate isomerase-like protein (cupin superfamily)